MIWPFKKRPLASNEVFAVYNAIVAQSRQKHFYAEWGVPDTVTGRFDMITLHLCLVFRRLRPGPNEDKAFAQQVFDLFFKDMDRSLREMGVGDIAVPKKVEKMGSAFYGLLEKITTALDTNDQAGLTATVNRNIYDEQDPENAQLLADYIVGMARHLDTQAPQDIKSGVINMEKAA